MNSTVRYCCIGFLVASNYGEAQENLAWDFVFLLPARDRVAGLDYLGRSPADHRLSREAAEERVLPASVFPYFPPGPAKEAPTAQHSPSVPMFRQPY